MGEKIFKFGFALSKLGALGVVATLTMGNQSCDQASQSKVRMLKQNVELQPVIARNILFPGGSNFDFPSVANWQMIDELNADNRFVMQIQGPSLKSTVEEMPLPLAAFAHEKVIASKPSIIADPTIPACLQGKAQVVIAGQINSFEISGGGGITIGFGPTGGYSGVAGMGDQITVDFAQMDMGLHAWSPWYNNYLLGAGRATSTDTRIKISATINLGAFVINPQLYFQSRLAEVTRTGIRKSLNALVRDMDKRALNEKRPVWEGQVTEASAGSNYVRLNAGRIHNLRVGDQFAIYNVRTDWDGAPCASTFTRETTTTDPIALATVAEEGDLDVTYTLLKVVAGTGERIYPGAVVRISQLAPNPVPVKK